MSRLVAVLSSLLCWVASAAPLDGGAPLPQGVVPRSGRACMLSNASVFFCAPSTRIHRPAQPDTSVVETTAEKRTRLPRYRSARKTCITDAVPEGAATAERTSALGARQAPRSSTSTA